MQQSAQPKLANGSLRCFVCNRTYSFPETFANHLLVHEESLKSDDNRRKLKLLGDRKSDILKNHPQSPYYRSELVTTAEYKVQNVSQKTSFATLPLEPASTTWMYAEPERPLISKDSVRDNVGSVTWTYEPSLYKKCSEESNQILNFTDTSLHHQTSEYEEYVPKPFESHIVTKQVSGSCLTQILSSSNPPLRYDESFKNKPTIAPHQTDLVYTSSTPTLATSNSNQSQLSNDKSANFSDESVSLSENVPVEEEKCFKCGFCLKSFSFSETFTNHLMAHREKPFCVCSACDKMFETPSALEEHIRTHNTNKHFECLVCSHTFTTWLLAKDHVAQHLNQNIKAIDDYIAYVS